MGPGTDCLCGRGRGAVAGTCVGRLLPAGCVGAVGPGSPAALVRDDVAPWRAGEWLKFRVPA
eukprot:12972711-Heterocapsa_arctica.AAC.1